jgi:hypothetical protein
VGFSYLSSTVELISIAPLKIVPFQRVVNRLLDGVHARLTDCRRNWWTTNHTTCLSNKWAMVSTSGEITVILEISPDSRQIGDAICDPETERLEVTFQAGTTPEVSKPP